ncbi:Sulfurtransferase [Nymphon striatum]|nr:Sulfurtransferase [Nymphon striatum]
MKKLSPIVNSILFGALLLSPIAHADIPGIKTGAQLQTEAEKRTTIITTEALKKALDTDLDMILVDVRTPTEIPKLGGSIKASQNVNIPRGWLEYRITNSALSKDTPIVLYCGGGVRTPMAADTLQKMGYTNVKNYSAGFLGWKNAGINRVTSEIIDQATDYKNNFDNNNQNTQNYNKQQGYPVEQPFKPSLIITTLLVLIPALLVYWFFGDSSNLPRSLKLFFGNWISPIILWFFVASLLHLLLKRNKLRKEQLQTRSLTTRIIPSLLTDADPDVSASQFNSQLEQSAIQSGVKQNNLLLSRLSLFLNHHENDVDETFGIKEREFMRGSFSLPRFMVWAIPIIGFIGTVWGISNGIAHFSDAMTSTSSVTDVSAMLKENLPLVTNSLATAFDTTLLALLLSIPLMMIMIWLEKEEEGYLIDLEESWFHDVKPKLTRRYESEISMANIGSSEAISSQNGNSNPNDTGNAVVANEIKLLSTQIKALQETMEDLYETVFTSKLNKK